MCDESREQVTHPFCRLPHARVIIPLTNNIVSSFPQETYAEPDTIIRDSIRVICISHVTAYPKIEICDCPNIALQLKTKCCQISSAAAIKVPGWSFAAHSTSCLMDRQRMRS